MVKKCKLHVHGHDVCNIAPPTCISVNFVEIPLNFIRSNIHKTVILYKTVQSLCSDVVVQNVNVIPLVACEVVSFKKHHDDSLVKCFMLKSSPFAGHHQYYYRHYHHYCHHHYPIIIIISFSVTTIIIFIVIIISIIVKFTVIIIFIIIITLKFISNFFDIRSSSITFVLHFIYVLFNYLFSIIY